MSERTDLRLPCPQRANRRRVRWPLGAATTTVAAVAVATALALAACSSPAPEPGPTTAAAAPAPTSTSTSTTTTTPPPSPTTPALPGLPGGTVLAVKIDNTAGARPRLGIERAEVVYVEPVEGGLTRLMAVFSTGAGDLPPEVGPIRSARETDVALLANWAPVGRRPGGTPASRRRRGWRRGWPGPRRCG